MNLLFCSLALRGFLRCSVSRWHKMWHRARDNRDQKFSRWISRKIQSCKKKSQKNRLNGPYLILLFIHLEEQTDSGKCKNITQKYIKFISAWCFYIFLNRFVLRDEWRAKFDAGWFIIMYNLYHILHANLKTIVQRTDRMSHRAARASPGNRTPQQ